MAVILLLPPMPGERLLAHARGDAPQPLNDTGITLCAGHPTGGQVACDGAQPAGQDAHHGRDMQAAAGRLAKSGGGVGGFDFTVLDASGNPVARRTGLSAHACVRDNVSGLTWEVKSNDGGLRDMAWRYTWGEKPSNNEGMADICGGTLVGKPCTTQNYVAAVQASRLCGHEDWRMPTVKELEGIVSYARTGPAIDTEFFPNTSPRDYWTGSEYAGLSRYAWIVSFNHGHSYGYYRSYPLHVRLVRGGR